MLVHLHGFAKADRQLLGSIGGDTLGCIGHEGVGQPLFQHFPGELFGGEDAGVHHHRHGFLVCQGVHQFVQVFIAHFLADAFVAQQAAQDGQGGMQGIEAGADLHFFGFVYRFPVGEIDACLFQGHSAGRKFIFHHQIFRFFGIDKGGGIGVLFGDDGIGIFETAFLQHFGHTGIGAGGDLVDHGDGEGHLGFILQVGEEGSVHQIILGPAHGDAENRSLQLVAVAAAVIHADQGNGQLTGPEAAVQPGSQFPHGGSGFAGAVFDIGLNEGENVSFGVFYGIAFFGDGERYHLQRRSGKHFHQALIVRFIFAVAAQRFAHGGDHFFVHRAIAFQHAKHAQAVKGTVGFINDFPVKAFGYDHTLVAQALVQQKLQIGGGEGAENVAGTQVQPDRSGFGFLCHFFHIETGQGKACVQPGLFFFQGIKA